MFALLMALVIAVVGVAPLLVFGRLRAAIITGLIAVLVNWLILYPAVPSFVWPMFGGGGAFVLGWWAVAAVVHSFSEDSYSPGLTKAAWFPLALLVVFMGRGCVGWGAFRANEYANLIGSVEERAWTQDNQPADARHVRLVPRELAVYYADKQLGEAGAIGSQFETADDLVMLQRIKGELWYVIPLDFASFAAWKGTDAAPGYVLVHGEDPRHDARLVTGQKLVYTPGAYFWHNLERHLRATGYQAKGLTEFSLEIDEDGKPWWVVTVFEPTIAWRGTKITGVVIVNPETGAHTFHAMGKVPEWVDRVVPGKVVEEWIDERGTFKRGWVNQLPVIGDHVELTEAEGSDIVYGADGQPYWVNGVTSTNAADKSVVGFMYTNSRTGRATFYRASGGTDAAVQEAVNNAVSNYKGWHAASPVLYNVYGTMASIVPVLGENWTFQRIAIVNVQTLEVALGENAMQAFRVYQRNLTNAGEQVAPEAASRQETRTGTVQRIVAEVKSGNTVYYVLIEGIPHLLSGASELSPELPVTQSGDVVRFGYVETDEDVLPLISFNNTAIALERSAAQAAVAEQAKVRQGAVLPVRSEPPADSSGAPNPQ